MRIRDDALAALRRGRADDERLLSYRDGGDRHDVRAEEVNERLRELVGGETPRGWPVGPM